MIIEANKYKCQQKFFEMNIIITMPTEMNDISMCIEQQILLSVPCTQITIEDYCSIKMTLQLKRENIQKYYNW